MESAASLGPTPDTELSCSALALLRLTWAGQKRIRYVSFAATARVEGPEPGPCSSLSTR
jgi:hypothetical protein